MKQKRNLFSASLTVLILTLFLIAGPANALDASLDIGDHTPDEKDDFTFQIHVKSETSQLEKITLKIEGNNDFICTFYPNATTIDDCEDISIHLTSNYGYGYGYSQELTYMVTWDTPPVIDNKKYLILAILEAKDGSTLTKTEKVILQNKNSCTPDWDCDEWSICTPFGYQERECIDKTGCRSPEPPLLKRTCEHETIQETIIHPKETKKEHKTILILEDQKEQITKNIESIQPRTYGILLGLTLILIILAIANIFKKNP